MVADKRVVHTDALDSVGTLSDHKQPRDAVHFAVESVMAGETLRPGDDIGFLPDGSVGYVDKPVGIVDPFLKVLRIKKGDWLWLFVYPREITSLRHVWTHPDFPATPDLPEFEPAAEVKLIVDATPAIKAVARVRENLRSTAAEVWITAYAGGFGISYDTLIDAARDFLRYGTLLEDDRVGDQMVSEEFWNNYEKVTGTAVPHEDRGDFFAEESMSCGC